LKIEHPEKIRLILIPLMRADDEKSLLLKRIIKEILKDMFYGALEGEKNGQEENIY